MQYFQPDFRAIADSLYTTNLASNRALLHWRYPHNSQGFKIQYRPVGSNTWQSAASAGSTLSKKLNNLQSNTRYEWKIAALCRNDTSSLSDKSFFTTKAAAVFAAGSGNLSSEDGLLIVYPNPAKGMFRVSVTKGTIASLKITNANGNIVYNNSNIHQQMIDVKLDDNAAGTYMLSIFGGSKTIHKKLVIEK